MINTEQFKKVVKGNISVDKKKSMERIPTLYKGATTAQKAEIKKLTGLSPNNFYGVAKSGSASPKVVLVMAQVLNISPKYFTGEINDKKPCEDVELTEIFKNNNGSKKVSPVKAVKTNSVKKATPKPSASKTAGAVKKTQPKATVNKTVKTANPVKESNPNVNKAAAVKPAVQKSNTATKPNKPIKPEKTISLDDEAMMKLLEALLIKSKFSDKAALTRNLVESMLLE